MKAFCSPLTISQNVQPSFGSPVSVLSASASLLIPALRAEEVEEVEAESVADEPAASACRRIDSARRSK